MAKKEILMLEQLSFREDNKQDSILKIYDSFSFRGHLFIITEMLHINLYEYISKPMFSGMPRNLIKVVCR